MKLKNISILTVTALLSASLLCGCNGEQQNSSDSVGNSSSVSEPAESIDHTPSVPEDATFLKGALGDPIGLSEITVARGAEFTEIPPEELSEDNFGEASADCAYYAHPKYTAHTSLDDEFDEDNLVFKGVPEGKTSGDYIKVKAGDKINGLTVKKASSFFNQNAVIIGGIVGTSIELDGEAVITGYAWIEQQDDYGVSAGDIRFIPTGDVQLPVVRFNSSDENGIPNRINGAVSLSNGIYFANDFGGIFSLGNTGETTADISALPNDGSYAKVNVTVSGIKMSTTLDWLTRINADIVSVELAE